MSIDKPCNHEPVDVQKILAQVVIDLIQHFFDLGHSGKTEWKGDAGAPENLQAEVNFLLALNCPFGWRDQAWAPYQSAVVFRFSTIWCCRTYNPTTWLFLMVCAAAKLYPEDVFSGWLTEASIGRLNKAIKKMRRVAFKIMNAADPENFQLFLEDVAQYGGPNVVHCDWGLEEYELQSVGWIVQHKDILFVWPGK